MICIVLFLRIYRLWDNKSTIRINRDKCGCFRRHLL